jgi:hypothetical protein
MRIRGAKLLAELALSRQSEPLRYALDDSGWEFLNAERYSPLLRNLSPGRKLFHLPSARLGRVRCIANLIPTRDR